MRWGLVGLKRGVGVGGGGGQRACHILGTQLSCLPLPSSPSKPRLSSLLPIFLFSGKAPGFSHHSRIRNSRKTSLLLVDWALEA